MPAACSASASGCVPIVRHVLLSVSTERPLEFVDLTAAIDAAVGGLGLLDGIVTVQTQHTTTGILVNEHEPLLLDDLASMFERLAPASTAYAHDDAARRTVNLGPGERRNGHAHCRAALLRTSEAIPVAQGTLALGRWQRVFLVDFDGPQRRGVSLTLMGTARGGMDPAAHRTTGRGSWCETRGE